MKKFLFLSAVFLAISLSGLGQATPYQVLRVASATTGMGCKVPVGTHIWDIANGVEWVVTSALESTSTLVAPTPGSVVQLSHPKVSIGTANGLSVDASTQVLTIGTASSGVTGALSGTDWTTFNNKVTSVSGSGAISSSGGATPTISIANAAADGSTKGAASFTANDFDAASGNISLDYANGQKATGSVAGFLSSADWTTFNNKDGSVSNEGSLTVTAGAANTSVIHSNTSGSTDVTLSAGTGMAISESGNTITLSAKTAAVDDFEQGADSITIHDVSYYNWVVLSQTAASGTVQVQLNGMTLKPTTQYVLWASNTKIRFKIPVYKYDQISVQYSY